MTGYPFTWERGRGTREWVEERLDRVVAEERWSELNDRTMVYNILTTSSNHSALFMDIYGNEERRGYRAFHFENAWLLDEGCKGVVEGAWSQSGELGLQERLSFCGERLRRWGGDSHHKFGRRIADVKRQMNSLRGRYDDGSLDRFGDVDGRLGLLQAQEETFWRQRAKKHWLRGADLNTKG